MSSLRPGVDSPNLRIDAPNLIIDVLPSLNDKAYYLPLAPKALGETEQIKIGLRLSIRNNGTAGDPKHDPVTITGIKFVFADKGIVLGMHRVQEFIEPAGGVIAVGDTVIWSNGSVCLVNGLKGCPKDEKRYNQVYLDKPAPSQIVIKVSCDGFTFPAEKTMDLIPWTDPTGFGAVKLPFVAGDLDDDEYVITSARHWYNGSDGRRNGTQIFAHDITIQALVNGEWTDRGRAKEKKPRAGRDRPEVSSEFPRAIRNEDIRIFGRPVRALADGEVFAVSDGHNDNPYKGKASTHYGSNYVWARYGNLEVKYSHLRNGSIRFSSSNLPIAVKAGQKLAEAGNSGNTGGDPHLHMECRISSTHPDPNVRGTLCPFTFRDTWMLERSQVPADGSPGPRVKIVSKGICREKAALRPFDPQLGKDGNISVGEIETKWPETFGSSSGGMAGNSRGKSRLAE